MNGDLLSFLRTHGIEDIQKFNELMQQQIVCTENIVSSDNMAYASYDEAKEEVVPLSKIIGCSKGNLKFDKSFLANFDNFFDSKAGDAYHSRSVSLLSIPVENIMESLERSFRVEPIKTVSINDNYFIAGNGLHRFMALKMYYMVELYQGKTPQELDEKYKIKIVNKNLDVFKTFASSLGLLFNPPIKFSDEMNRQEWLEKVKERVASFQDNPQKYQLLVSNISFNFFNRGEPGEAIIQFLNEYFPNMFKDVVKNICVSSYYESVTEIVDCVDKYFPDDKLEISQIINRYLIQNTLGVANETGYKHFDLTANWANYGEIKDLSNETKSRRDLELHNFSEGSSSLEKCLKILWKRGLKTKACCKGNHLSINCDNKPEVNCESYIAFEPDSDWLEYIPSEIINDEDVIISENAIYYYGKNKNQFFDALTLAVLAGKKDNIKELNEKLGKMASSEMEYKAFLYSLQEIGFDEEQIIELSKSYLDIEKWSKGCYTSGENDEESNKIIENWREAKERFECDLRFYINRNNEKLQSGMKF